MGKKSYDSYSDMSMGSGNRFARPKKNTYPMVTDKMSHSTYEGYGGKANVMESRLNKGGDRYYKGKRSKAKMLGNYGGRMMSKY